MRAAGRQQGFGERGLGERLAARDGNATAGLLEKQDVAFNLLKGFGNADAAAGHLASAGSASAAEPELLTLRIVTPPTGERTAFEEHRRADAGTIVQREPHDVENNPGTAISRSP
jgi:hypothetical protein